MGKIETDKLQTLSNYARSCGIAYVTVCQRLETGKLECVEIDGVRFIDNQRYPHKKKWQKDDKGDM